MTSWSAADERLLRRWVAMAAPLIGAGAPDDAVRAHLTRQMGEDVGAGDTCGLAHLIAAFRTAMQTVAEAARET